MSPPARTEPAAVTPQLLRGWPLPELDDDGTKHDRGTVLVVGGAASTPGAVLLAGLAALRAGAGRLQVLTVQATAVSLAVAIPEAAVLGVRGGESLDASSADQVLELAANATAVVLGPGLLDKDEARALVAAVLPRLTCPRVVVDALALIGLSGRPELLEGLEAVLTPNSGELAALLDGAELPAADAAGNAVQRAAQEYDAVVAAQGWVVDRAGQSWRNEAGGVGLGTSGSGDVLAGVVGGLLARGADPAQAAVWGQYLHAAAGDRCTADSGRVGFLARELLPKIPRVVASLHI
jgi:hydroxyethylthiazole kinase-like uncharacterized protein yjeF